MLALSSSLFEALRHQSAHSVGMAVVAFTCVIVGTLGMGALSSRLLWLDSEDPYEVAALILGLGLSGYGAVLLAVGFLPVLERGPLAAISLAAALPAIVWRSELRGLRALPRAISFSARRSPIEWGSLTLIGIGAGLAGFLPSTAPDEVDYHLAAPNLWAAAGRWVTSPYRFTNGFHFAEILYTPAAVFGSPTAAHWTHVLTLVLLALATGAMARRLGGSGALAAATLIAARVFVESWWAYNDVFAAAMLVAAMLAAMKPHRRQLVAAGLLCAAALSIKPIFVLLTPGLAVIAWRARRTRSLSDIAPDLVALAAPSVVAAGGWFAYTRFFAGVWFQRGGLVVAHGSREAAEKLATIRIPDLTDVVLVPFLPIVTAVIGGRANYGDRTSVLIAFSMPLIGVTLWKSKGEARTRLCDAAVPAIAMYLVAATLIERTRFLIPVYALIAVAAAVALAWWSARPGRVGQYLRLVYRFGIVIGSVDLLRFATG